MLKFTGFRMDSWVSDVNLAYWLNCIWLYMLWQISLTEEVEIMWDLVKQRVKQLTVEFMVPFMWTWGSILLLLSIHLQSTRDSSDTSMQLRACPVLFSFSFSGRTSSGASKRATDKLDLPVPVRAPCFITGSYKILTEHSQASLTIPCSN